MSLRTHRPTPSPRHALLGLAMAALLGLSATAQAAGKRAPAAVLPAAAPAAIGADTQACLALHPQQDLDSCLKEAGAARAEARHGLLDDGPALYQQNALRRCDSLPSDLRLDCQARMQGQGLASGSVDGGGIYRELQTTIPAPPPEAR